MRFLALSLTFALGLSGLASAQNIYDGCGVDKECLGYEPDNPTENACLEAQVCERFFQCLVRHMFAFKVYVNAMPAVAPHMTNKSLN